MNAPELQHLRAFAAVARHRSFRGAARTLDLSPSALSQSVRQLEERLGLVLLHRSTRSVTLTEAGEHFLAGLQPALLGLQAVLDGAAQWQGEAVGTLRLNVPRNAARLVLMPWLQPFLKAHPRVQLELCTQDARVDIVREGFDAGVRFSGAVPQDMVALPLGGPLAFAVVATPAWVQDHGLPTIPADLVGQACIRQRFPSGTLYRWEFERAGQRLALEVAGPLTVDDQALALQAALDGVGWAYVYEALAADALQQGRLRRVLADWCPPQPGFQLYYPARRQASPSLRAFIAWLQGRAVPADGA